MNKTKHIPVLIDKIIHYLEPQAGGVYVDCTFGAGGYSKALLDSADCTVIAIDRDPSVQEIAKNISSKEEYKDRFIFAAGNFDQIGNILAQNNIDKVDGIIVDLGVSSMQLDQANRGFSFQKQGPLDMRMEMKGSDAADFVNEASEEEIADILYRYGDERKSRKIARKIVYERQIKKIEDTKQLANIVHSVIFNAKNKTDSATKTFQAIRIHVNDELGSLERLLAQTPELLCAGGKFISVAFHSLEDKLIKEFMDKKSGRSASTNRYLPEKINAEEAIFKIFSRKAIGPTQQEIEDNVRARSAKLRIATKLSEQDKKKLLKMDGAECYA